MGEIEADARQIQRAEHQKLPAFLKATEFHFNSRNQ